MIKKLIFCLSLTVLLSNFSFGQEEVTLPGTQVRQLQSEIVDQLYELHISLPADYSESDDNYGVVYLLDGQWDFPLVYAIYGEQHYDGFLPPLIVVGITWADGETWRARDFSPTPQEGAGGGADKFLDFIKDELTPYLEKEFRVKPNDRTLMGSSLGGLFTIYAALQEPDFFQNYIPTSPAISWDRGEILKMEKAFAKDGKSLKGRMYLAVGGDEQWVPDFLKFVEKLSERDYEDFVMDYKVIEGAGHSGCKAEGNTRGLQFVYAGSK